MSSLPVKKDKALVEFNYDMVEIDDCRSKISFMENEIGKCEQVEFEVINHFSNGVYARELHIPKGTVLVGKIHKHENLNIISKGDISVLTEEGVKRVTAPATVVSPPGTKRVGYAHEDTVWTTIHATEETDVDVIEKLMIAETFSDVVTIEDSNSVIELMAVVDDKKEEQ